MFNRLYKILFKSLLKGKVAVHTQFQFDKNHEEIFEFEYIPTFDPETKDFMFRFSTAKNAKVLVGRLLIIVDELGFKAGEATEMFDEIWISSKSINGTITISLNIYDDVFILAENNKTDLDYIYEALLKSKYFKEKSENKVC